MKYSNTLPNHKNTNMGSPTVEQWTEIHLHGVDMRDVLIQN